MANVNANVNVLITTQQAQAQLSALQAKVTAFNKGVVSSSGAAVAQQAAMNKALMDGAVASRMFTARIIPVTSSVENFSRSLEKGRLSLGQYTRFAGSQLPGMSRVFRREFETINRLAESNVKRLQTQFVSAGAAAGGMNKAIALTPTRLNTMAAAQSIANQKAMIFNKLMRDGSTSLLNWGKNTQWAGRQLMVGFTIPLTIFAGLAAKTFRDLEAQAINFRKVYGDIFTTTAEVNENLAQVRELSKEYTRFGVAVRDTMELAAIAAQAGQRGAALQSATEQATRLAVLGQMQGQDAMRATIALQSAFVLSNEELTDSINFMNMVNNSTVLSLQDMAEAIPRVAPVIKGLGGDVRDMAVLLTAMREGGVSAAEGANGLKSSLGRLIAPSRQARDMAESFGISLERIVQTNRGDLLGTIRALATEMEALGDLEKQQLLSSVFGRFQFARMGALFENINREGSQAQTVIERLGMSVEDLAEIADKEMAAVEESAATKFTAAMQKAQLAIAPIGEAFLKAITPLLNGIANLFDRFNDLPDGVKNAMGIVIAVIGGIAPITLMVIGLIGNLLANGLKFINVLRKLFARLRGTSSQFSEMAIAEQEAALASASLEGKVSSLTDRMLLQREALSTLITLYGKYAGAANAAAGAMPLGFSTARISGGGPASPFGGMTAAGPDFRGFNKGVVKVPGVGNEDTIPALLTPGESVITKEATQKYGAIISAMNDGTLPGFNDGVQAVGLPSGIRYRGKTEEARFASEQKFQAMRERYVQLGGTTEDFTEALISVGTDATASMSALVAELKTMGKDLGLKPSDRPREASITKEAAHLTDPIAFDDPRVQQELISSGDRGAARLVGETLFPGTTFGASKLTAGIGMLGNQNLTRTGILPADFAREWDVGGREQLLPALSKIDPSILQSDVSIDESRILADNIRDKAIQITEQAGKQKITDTELAEATRQVIEERKSQAAELSKTNAEEAAARQKVIAAAESAAQQVGEVRQYVGTEDVQSGLESGLLVREGQSIVPNLESPETLAALQQAGISPEDYARLSPSAREVAREGSRPASALGTRPPAELSEDQMAQLGIPSSTQIDDAVQQARTDADNAFSEGSSAQIGAQSPATQGTQAVDDYVAGMRVGVEQNASQLDALGRETGQRYDESVKAAISGDGQDGGGVPPSVAAAADEPRERPTPSQNEQQIKEAINQGEQDLLNTAALANQSAKKTVLTVKDAAKGAGKEVGNIFRVLPQTAHEIARNFKEPAQAIGTVFKQIGEPYYRPIINAANKAKLAGKKAYENVRSRITEAGNKFTQLPKKIQTGVNKLRDRLGAELSKVRGGFEKIGQQARVAGSVVANPVPRALAISAATTKSMEMLNNGMKKIKTTLDPVAKKINEFGARVVKAGQTVSKAGQIMMNPVARSIAVAAVMDKTLKPALAQVGKAAETVRSKLSSFGAAVSRGAQIIANPVPRALALTAIQQELVKAGKFVAQTIKTNVSSALNIGKKAIASGFVSTKKFIANSAKGVAAGVKTAFSAVKTSITTGFNAARTKVTSEFTRIATVVRTEGPRLRAAFSSAATGAVGAIKGAGTILAQSVKGVGSQVAAAGRGVAGFFAGGVDAQGRTRGARIAGMGNQAMMGLMGVSMAASFAGGALGDMAQKIMPVSMGLMALNMILPMLKSPLGLLTFAAMGLAAGFIFLRKQADDAAKAAAQMGANMGQVANGMKVLEEATGFKAPRPEDRLFRFTPEDREAMSEFGEYFKSEAGSKFIQELRDATSEERYERVRALLAQGIASGMEEEKAKAFGQAIAEATGDALLNSSIARDFANQFFRSGSQALIDLESERMSLLPSLDTVENFRELSNVAQNRLVAKSREDMSWWQNALDLSFLPEIGGVRLGQTIPTLLNALKQIPALKGVIEGLPKIPQITTSFGDAAAEIETTIKPLATNLGFSLQTIQNLANAEAVLEEERRNGVISIDEYLGRSAELEGLQQRASRSIGDIFAFGANAGALMQAYGDQLSFAGFSEDQISRITEKFNPEELARQIFGEEAEFAKLSEAQRKYVEDVFAATVSGLTPENVSQRLQDVEGTYSAMATRYLDAVENGLFKGTIQEWFNRENMTEMIRSRMREALPPGGIGALVPETLARNVAESNEGLIRIQTDSLEVFSELLKLADQGLAIRIMSDPNQILSFGQLVADLRDLPNIGLETVFKAMEEQGLTAGQAAAGVKKSVEEISKIKLDPDIFGSFMLDAQGLTTQMLGLGFSLAEIPGLVSSGVETAMERIKGLSEDVFTELGNVTITSDIVTNVLGVEAKDADAVTALLKDSYPDELPTSVIPLFLSLTNPELISALAGISPDMANFMRENPNATEYVTAAGSPFVQRTAIGDDQRRAFGVMEILRSAGDASRPPRDRSQDKGGSGGGGKSEERSFLEELIDNLAAESALYLDAERGLKGYIRNRGRFLGAFQRLRRRGVSEDIIASLGTGPEALRKARELLNLSRRELGRLVKQIETVSVGRAIENARRKAIEDETRLEAKRRLERRGISPELQDIALADTELTKAIATTKVGSKEYDALMRVVRRLARGKRNLAEATQTEEEAQISANEAVIQSLELEMKRLELRAEQDFAREQGKTVDQVREEIAAREFLIKQLERQVAVLERANKKDQDRIDILSRQNEMFERQKDAIQRQIQTLERANEMDQRRIEDIRRQDAIRNRVAEALNYELELMSRQEDKINESYEKRIKSLDDVAKLNDRLIRQQRQQLGLSQAIAEGDIFAATAAAQEMRAEFAQFAREQLREGMERSRDLQIENLRTEGGLTREQAEERLLGIKDQSYQTSLQIRDIEDVIYARTQSMIPLRDQIYNIDLQIRDVNDQIRDINDQIYDRNLEIKEIQDLQIDPLVQQNDESQFLLDKLDERIRQESVQHRERVAQLERQNQFIAASVQGAGNLRDMTNKAIRRADALSGSWRGVEAAARAAAAAMGGASVGAFAGGVVGYAMGGKVKKYPMGGLIPYAVGGVAGDGGRDSVRALLTPGEFVIRKSMVNKYGIPMMEAINQGAFSLPKYNVGQENPSILVSSSNVANINAPVYNTYDMDFVINGASASADEIANKVMFKMKQVQNQQIRGNRGY